MGVHANLCLLKRSFGIIGLTSLGMKVVLMRDLTDVMYNPQKWPYVNHFVAKDLVTWYIEKNWCPTISSEQILGDKPFTFAEDTLPPRKFEDYKQIFDEQLTRKS